MIARLSLQTGIAILLASCAREPELEPETEPVDPAPANSPSVPVTIAPTRPQLDGRDFPPGVLALTWDDGPDDSTLALATFLHREHVAATFFVVGAWQNGISSDPGFGPHAYQTGHRSLPILGDLVALGHRLGNHTLHHVLLGDATTDVVEDELGANQRAIDPYVLNELPLFRAPGGDWSASASRALDARPDLAALIGPVRWDIDSKDWEGSLYCRSTRPGRECDHGPMGPRVRADVTAERYVRAVEAAGHGIVLMHDRVGDVGSDYALAVARIVIPRLIARGYVFAAPVLAFSQPTERSIGHGEDIRLGDVDGDGLADSCTRAGDKLTCAFAAWDTVSGSEPRVVLADATHVDLAVGATDVELADVDGDGRADVCARVPSGVACALSRGRTFGEMQVWSSDVWDAVRFGDIDADGRTDVCGTLAGKLVCARSRHDGFGAPQIWLHALPIGTSLTSLRLADVTGDGRADVCFTAQNSVFCAAAMRGGFARPTLWSPLATPVVLGDVNGDGRADACAKDGEKIVCALSNGKAFTKPTTWLQWAPRSYGLGDLNGDGRADICSGGSDGAGIRCGLAP